MTEPTNGERARRAALAVDAFRASDGHGRMSTEDVVTELLTCLRQYADRYGIDVDEALAAASRAYTAQRGNEEHAYRVGQEAQLRNGVVLSPALTTLPSLGVVAALYLGGLSPQAYAIRFPGEVNAMPFIGSEIEPGPPFPPIRTSQGTVRSLNDAEDALIRTATRIRMDRLIGVRAAGSDTRDQRLLAAALGEICNLTPEQMLGQVDLRVTAKMRGDLATRAAVELGREDAGAGIAPLEAEREAIERLVASLREQGLTVPADPVFQRILLSEYRAAFDEASGQLQGHGPDGITPTVAVVRLTDRDFPQGPGKYQSAVPAIADPAASNHQGRHARRGFSPRST
jgi:hypothetical protein